MSKGFIIAGTNSGVGKTTISLGIMAVLADYMKVQPFKTGPDYIDTAYHSYVTGKKSRSLDTWINTEETVKYLFDKSSCDADISVIEGVMGLYDSKEIGEKRGSTAYLAETLGLPVVLIVDGKGMAGSAAAVVKGYAELNPEARVRGVIFNNVGKMHYELLKEAVEAYTNVKAYGYIERLDEVEIPERYLGLLPSHEAAALDDRISILKENIKKTIDFEGLIRFSKDSKDLWVKKIEIEKKEPIRIGLAKDKAFNFYYEDNIDLLKEMGAEIIEFSPIQSTFIPNNLQLLLFGGGFPEVFAGELQDNGAIRRDLCDRLADGIPYLAECGGMMYLCKELIDFDGKKYEMTGYLKGYAEMTQKLQRFGYATLEIESNCIYGNKGSMIKIHEFHRSKEYIQEKKALKIWKDKKNVKTQEWTCGYVKGNGISTYAHLHYYSNLKFIENVYDKALEYKNIGRKYD
jgi:cobyrinic acid a,c-diamide synthase